MSGPTGKAGGMNWRQILKTAEEVTAATLAELPAPVGDEIRSVPILLEKLPSPDDVADGIEPDTLGYFDVDDAGLVRIRLWLENILDYSDHDPEIFREEIRTTLLHEIGHVLGWDEDEIDVRGLG
ncbi:MAG: metallopeptidase family protein [Verrucomicrobiae bacterium]